MIGVVSLVILGSTLGLVASVVMPQQDLAHDKTYRLRFMKRKSFLMEFYEEMRQLTESTVNLLDSLEKKADLSKSDLSKFDHSMHRLKTYYEPMYQIYLKNTSLAHPIARMIELTYGIEESVKNVTNGSRRQFHKFKRRIKDNLSSMLIHYQDISQRLSDVEMLLWI